MNGTTSTSQIRPISSCRCGAYEPNPIEVLMHQMLHNGSEYSILMAKRTFRRGQHLYRPGANGKHVYSINRGTFKTYRIGDDGRERIAHQAERRAALFDLNRGRHARCHWRLRGCH